MTDHGPLFDEFRRQPSHPHGGSEFDEGFNRNPGADPGKHGALADEGYRKLARVSAHGDFRWDEFGWHQMPAKHGQQFDSDFGQPVALENGEHGTWQDIFRGGTHLRYLIDGHDVEGIVIDCRPTHALVQQKYRENQGGAPKPVEIGLGQITEWRWANETGQAKRQRRPVAHPGDTPADVPTDLSSPSLSAGGHGPRTAGPSPGTIVANKADDAGLDVLKAVAAIAGADVDEEDDALVEKAFEELAELDEAIAKRNVGRGSATPKSAPIHAGRKSSGAPRHPNGKIDHAAARAVLQERSAAFRAGVAAKREHTLPKVQHGGFTCIGCGHHSFRQHPVAAPSGGVHKQIAMRGCASCGTMHPHRIGKTDVVDLDVAKSVDTSETALLPTAGSDGGGNVEKVGHRTGCPRGGNGPCGADQGGHCTLCGAEVHDHEATGKSGLLDLLADVRKVAGATA